MGDVCLGWSIAEKAAAEPRFDPVPPLSGALGKADLTIFNLECCPVRDPAAFPADFPGRPMLAPAGLLPAVRREFDVAILANNHIMDGDAPVFRETMELLIEQGFSTAGGGRDRAEAEAMTVLTAGGLRVGILASADSVPAPHRRGNAATNRRPGVAVYRPRRLASRVAAESSRVDVLVCVLHTGLEFHSHPDPELVRNARELIEAGACLVIVHHAHVVQGVERHHHGLIAYGLGNFIFDAQMPYMRRDDVRADRGLILDATFEAGRLMSFECRPAFIGADGITRLQGGPGEAAEFAEQIGTLSRQLGDERHLAEEWKKTCRRYLRSRALQIYWRLRDGAPVTALRLLTDLRRRENRRWLSGLLG